MLNGRRRHYVLTCPSVRLLVSAYGAVQRQYSADLPSTSNFKLMYMICCSPVPKDSVPREQLPMRDTMVFKSATKVPRVLHSTPHVPHS